MRNNRIRADKAAPNRTIEPGVVVLKGRPYSCIIISGVVVVKAGLVQSPAGELLVSGQVSGRIAGGAKSEVADGAGRIDAYIEVADSH